MARLPLALLILIVIAAPAFAGDETEDTPAAQLFREAWWQETGAGALDKALAGYEKALVAKGSKAVRARALYRMGVVLQRMGRVQEGVKALERLSREFGDQKELLAKAQARLEEWTAEDLRTSFSEWYKRYQYSPAFQSKIVDLVLKLAHQKEQNAAENELLTIGEPAVPALRAHATSANPALREHVVLLLTQLEALPPADALLRTRRWADDWRSYRMFMQLDAAQRESLKRELAGEHDGPAAARARWIRGALDGHDGLLAMLAAEQEAVNTAAVAWLNAIYATSPSDATHARLRAMVLDATVHENVRHHVARVLLHRLEHEVPTGMTVEDVVPWLESDSASLRRDVWRFIGEFKAPMPGVWRLAAKAVLSDPAPSEERLRAWQAMLGALRHVSPDEDLTLARKAAEHALLTQAPHAGDESALRDRSKFGGRPDAPRLVVAHGIEKAASQHLRHVVSWWWQLTGGGPDIVRTLTRWASHAATDRVREEAIALAAKHIETGVPSLMAAMEDPERRAGLAKEMFSGLGRNVFPIEDLDWDEASLTLLVQAADTHGSRGLTGFTNTIRGKKTRIKTRLGRDFSVVFHHLLAADRTRDMLLRVAQAEPQKVTEDIWAMLPKGWKDTDSNISHVVGLLDAAWDAWTTEQRIAGVVNFLDVNVVADMGREPGTRFIQKRLYESGIGPELTLMLLRRLRHPTLDDVRRVFDLAKPKDVDRAVEMLEVLPRTEAVYDAFVLALRPDGELAEAVGAWFTEGPASRRADLVRRLLASEDASAVTRGLHVLRASPRRTDIPLLVEALGHKSGSVRLAVANQMVHLYDKTAIKALARAVDDPDAAVQHAVLQTLSIIEKREQRKEYWRKFAEEIEKNGK